MQKRKVIACGLLAVALAVGDYFCTEEPGAVRASDQEAQESAVVEEERCTGAANPYGEPVQVKTTAYCSCKVCCGHSHGITRSGRAAKEGLTVASDTYYGKMVILYDEEMNFLGIYECMDTGVEYLDIYMESHEEAQEFGVHYYYIQAVDAVG